MSRALKTACIVATTEAISPSGEQEIDGVSVIEPMRVLVKDQPGGIGNGIRIVRAGGDWDWAPDFDEQGDIDYGAFVPVLLGTGGEPNSRVYMLNAGNAPVFGGNLPFALIGDSTGGGGSGGTLDPSDIEAIAGIAFVNAFTDVDASDRTGSIAAPFATIAAALSSIHIAARSGGESTLYMIHGFFFESLGFQCNDQSLALIALTIQKTEITGNHSVTVGGLGFGFRARGLVFNGTITVHDGLTPATRAPLEFDDCDKVSVLMNDGAEGVADVSMIGPAAQYPSHGSRRNRLYDVSVAGIVTTSGVQVGRDAGSPATTIACALFYGTRTVFAASTTLSLPAGAEVELIDCDFLGAMTVTFASGDPGELQMDESTYYRWTVTGGTKTLNNGVIRIISTVSPQKGELFVDPANAESFKNGSKRFPFATPAEAVAQAVENTGFHRIVLASGTYADALDIPSDANVQIWSDGSAQHPGAIEWTVTDGSGLQVEGVGALDITIVDESGAAADTEHASLFLRRCAVPSVAMGVGATSIVDLTVEGVPFVEDAIPRQRLEVVSLSVTGFAFLQGVQINDLLECDEARIEDCDFLASCEVNLSGTTLTLRRVEYLGSGVEHTFTGSAGLIEMDSDTANSYRFHGVNTDNGNVECSISARTDGPNDAGVTTNDAFNCFSGRTATVSNPTQNSPVGFFESQAYDTDNSVSRRTGIGLQNRSISGTVVSSILQFLKRIDGVVSEIPAFLTSAGDFSGRSFLVTGVALGDANATISLSGGAIRSIPANTLTDDRDYTLDPTGAADGDIIAIARYDATANTAVAINGGPGADVYTLAAGYTYYFPFDEASGNWDKPTRVKHL